MSPTVQKTLWVVGIFVVGTAVGRYSLPTKVVEKEKIVYQDRIVEKQVEVKDVSKKNHKIYVRIEKTSPDGTKTVETRIMDEGTTESTDKTNTDKTEDTTSTTEKSKETTYSQQSTIFSLLASTQLSNPTPNVGLMLQKRIIGPIYFGGFVFVDKTVGLGLGLAF